MLKKIIGGNNRIRFIKHFLGTPIFSRNSTIGFIWYSTDNKSSRGNDSIRYRKEASLEPNMPRPPRLASIYNIKLKIYLTIG
jgi:hypothetical protein